MDSPFAHAFLQTIMKLKKLSQEFDADLRNKITYPRILLTALLQSGSKAKKQEIRQAIKDLDGAVELIEKMSILFSKKNRGNP